MDREMLILSGLFLTGIMAGLYGFEPVKHAAGYGVPTQVINCSGNGPECTSDTINNRIADCRNGLESVCNRTKWNVEKVSLVTDSQNHVTASLTDASYTEDVVIERISDNTLWDLEFLPNNTPIWTGETKVNLSSENRTVTVKNLDPVRDQAAGLMGLAVDPDFENNRFIYIYYTHNRTDQRTLILKGENEFQKILNNRVSRFKLVNGELRDEKVLLTVPGSISHSGGRLEFGPDGKLWITTGDSSMLYRTQDLDFLGGKILG